MRVGNGVILKDYRELLKNADNYYFIIYQPDTFWLSEEAKLLQHSGIDEFGIVTGGYTKDFFGRRKLKEAFWDSLNEIFKDVTFLDWEALENLRRASFEGAGYWDVPYSLIYQQYRNKSKISYLEIGPGIGTMSLGLKKLLDIDVTWITIPNEEALWSEWKRKSALSLIKNKYNIHIKEGFIETDKFEGQYDIIVMAQVMEHLIFNPVNTFKKLAGLVKEDGFIFVSVPEDIKHYNVESYKDIPYPFELTEEERVRRTKINNFGHFHEYSYEEAMSVFEESNLECVIHVMTTPIHHFMLRKKVI